MTEIHDNKSGSDLSTDSWTLLDDNLSTEELILNQPSESIIEISEAEIENQNNEKQEETERKKSDGFLTFDEYLQEHMLEHDYEYDDANEKVRKSHKNKSKKGQKKYKARNLGIPVFISVILGLTAFATLCSSLSQPHAEKEIIPEVKIEPKKVNICHKLVQKQVNETIKELEELNNLKIVKESVNKMKQFKPEEKQKFIGPKLEHNTVTVLDKKQKESDKPKVSKISKCEASKTIFKTNKTKTTRSKWMLLKDILLDTNLHALFSLIITNIYLFTLLTDLNKKPSNKNCQAKCAFTKKILEDFERTRNAEEIRRLLFKELPFWNEDISGKELKKKKVKSSNSTIKSNDKSKKLNNLTVLSDTKDRFDGILFRSCPFLTQTKPLPPIIIPTNNEEAGKSECQRRFEELDLYQKKFNNLKQSQRDRIKLLKQKFRNEVSYIKDTEEESEARAEKINTTSQRFIKKLKYNREKYLLELKKVKDLRQKVAESKKQENFKSTASGCYSVSLPTIYDYGEKFKMIKEKFECENSQLAKEWKFK